MRVVVATGIALAVVGMVIALPDVSRAAFPWFDPFRTETMVSPEPGVPWKPRDPLPAVPALDVPVPFDPDKELTLPELTAYALRNNPQTREAWFAAQAE